MEPQRLNSIQGWEWIKQGFALFMKAPLLWIVILMIGLIATVVISNVPVVGEPLVSLIMPVILVGLMTGCRSLEQDEELELAHLFSGFYRHTTHLVTLGGISLVSQFMILGVMMLLGGADLVSFLMSGQPDPDPEMVVKAVAGAGLAVMVGAVLFSMLMMAMQYAPLLVFFNDIAPVQAMKLSFRAFTHNIGPMLVYFTTFMILAFLASMPAFLGWLVLLPLVFTSLYTSFRNIFPAAQEASDIPEESSVSDSEDGTF